MRENTAGGVLREEVLTGLLTGLHGLPPLLGEFYGERLDNDARLRLEVELAEAVRGIGYSDDGTAEQLQTQLAPWLYDLIASPELLDDMVERLRGLPPAVQEALHWCFCYEAASGYMELAGGVRQAEVHATFIPFICTGAESDAPVKSSPFAGALAAQTEAHGLVHPDELLLIVPFFVDAHALAALPSLSALLREAWDIAAQAWGPGLVPSLQAQAHWEAQWATRPQARQWRARPFAAGDVRFAVAVVVSPELSDEQRVPLEPWQQLEREEMRLRARFASDGHRLHSDSESLLAAAGQARVSWAEALIAALGRAGYPAMVGADPRDAYSALALAATHAAADLVGEAELSAGEDEPLVLLVDAAGMSVELAGRRRTLGWAPLGPLLPGMVRALALRLSRAVGREVSLSVALEREGWALIQERGSGHGG